MITTLLFTKLFLVTICTITSLFTDITTFTFWNCRFASFIKNEIFKKHITAAARFICTINCNGLIYQVPRLPIQQHCSGCNSTSTSPPSFLHVLYHTTRWTIMHNILYIRAIYSHTESHCSYDNSQLSISLHKDFCFHFI